MRNLLYFTILFSFLSCSNEKQHLISIDLNRTVPRITYSLFADSLSYLTLHTENQLVSSIEKLYVDGDYLFIQNSDLGIFVFSLSDGSLIKNINYHGQGPGEFGDIRAFTINANKKQVIIFSYPFVHTYTYDGIFIESIKNEKLNLIDFYCTNTGDYICMAPTDIGPRFPCGVWLVDSTLQYVRHLKEIPPQQMIYTKYTYYNRTANGIYYYDCVWDDLSFLTNDSAEVLYTFDLKQRIPEEMRLREQLSEDLIGYATIGGFANSEHYILLYYFKFHEGSTTWVLLDKRDNKVIASQQLLNDISEAKVSTSNLFYIDNRKWCRVVDFEEDDANIILEFIYLN